MVHATTPAIALLLAKLLVFTQLQWSLVYSTMPTRGSDKPININTVPVRFINWERCEQRWNIKRKRTEQCCRRNYKCSNKICQGQRLCSFGFFQSFLWCFHESCKSDKAKIAEKRHPRKEGDDASDPPLTPKKNAPVIDDKRGEKPSSLVDVPVPKAVSGATATTSASLTYWSTSFKFPSSSPSPSSLWSISSSSSPSLSPSSMPSPSLMSSPSSLQIPPPGRRLEPPSIPSQAAIPTPPSPTFNALRCDGMRKRREIRDLSYSERRNWQKAMLELHDTRDTMGQSPWDRFVHLHSTYSDEAHGGAYFLPWHRLFLLQFENEIRKRRPSFAMPYWDWSIDAHDTALSPVWKASFAGGAQRGNLPITSGAFRSVAGLYPRAHVVRRDFASGRSGEIATLWPAHALDGLIQRETWGAFSNGLEAAHALLHVYMGGDMANSHSAPNDPVFFLHHAFVDKLYEMRQNKRGVAEFDGTHDFINGTVTVSREKIFRGFNVPVNRAFFNDCVQYIPSRLTGRSRGGTRDKETPANVCKNSQFMKTHVLTEERCRNGENALRGSRSNDRSS